MIAKGCFVDWVFLFWSWLGETFSMLGLFFVIPSQSQPQHRGGFALKLCKLKDFHPSSQRETLNDGQGNP